MKYNYFTPETYDLAERFARSEAHDVEDLITRMNDGEDVNDDLDSLLTYASRVEDVASHEFEYYRIRINFDYEHELCAILDTGDGVINVSYRGAVLASWPVDLGLCSTLEALLETGIDC